MKRKLQSIKFALFTFTQLLQGKIGDEENTVPVTQELKIWTQTCDHKGFYFLGTSLVRQEAVFFTP